MADFNAVMTTVYGTGADSSLQVLIYVLAAFAGGALSGVVADWIQNFVRRRQVAASLRSELRDRLDSEDDYLQPVGHPQGSEHQMQARINLPSLNDFIEPELWGWFRTPTVREVALELHGAANRVNNMYEKGEARYAEDAPSGQQLLQEAGEYAKEDVYPLMRELEERLSSYSWFG